MLLTRSLLLVSGPLLFGMRVKEISARQINERPVVYGPYSCGLSLAVLAKPHRKRFSHGGMSVVQI